MDAAEPNVLVERDGRVGVVRLNRPKQLNALSGELMGALVEALRELDEDREIRAIVVAGNERAFAAGADINELAAGTAISLYENRRIDAWDSIRAVRTPIVAAVSGFCLGGGCELAMLCDLIVASESARFGQPEINLGVLPGAGGTQRPTRAVGKAVAMDLILTGRMLSAREALSFGLVARVVAQEAWLTEAKRVAAEIAAKSPVSVRLAKEAIDEAFEAPLAVGVEFERRAFYLARASDDATEGLNAFIEKRKPDFTGT
jgi:enoyl-CoA hydratase